MSIAIVVLSGGQDSMTCLGWALKRFDEIHAISFDYGQRHRVEIECAKEVCHLFGIDHVVVDMCGLSQVVSSDLLEGGISEEGAFQSFVPARNATMLSITHGYAQEVGAESIVAGMCQTDYNDYPDCRNVFIEDLETTLNRGYLTNISIKTPLMYLSKAEIFSLAEEVGFLDIVLEKSHTCYLGERKERNTWGYGCGECPACMLRKSGWEEYARNLGVKI